MFDIGFSEIVVIAVVALVVIGPEKLPKTARTLGVLFGRLQRYVGDVKADINREIELDELRRLQKEMQSAASEVSASVKSVAQGFESSVREVEASVSEATSSANAALSAPDAAGAGTAAAAAAAAAATPGAPAGRSLPPSSTGPDWAFEQAVAEADRALQLHREAQAEAEVAMSAIPPLAEPPAEGVGEADAGAARAKAEPDEPPRQAALPGFDKI